MWEGETVESSRPPDNLIKIKRSTHLGGRWMVETLVD